MSKNRLRALRFLAGKSQEELAFLSKVSQAKISRVERGFYEFNKEEKERIAIILAKELEGDPKDIFKEE